MIFVGRTDQTEAVLEAPVKIWEVRGSLTAAAGGWTVPSRVRYSIHFSSSCSNSP